MQIELTSCHVSEYYCGNNSAGNVENQEYCSEKNKHISRSLIHGMQPSDRNDLYNVSIDGTELMQQSRSPPSIADTITLIQFSVEYKIAPETPN
jgi:hypothetical protein